MLQQWKTPACTTRKSLLDTEIEVMSCVSIQTVFWLDVCQDQWSSWGISGLCFFIQGWPNLWINPLIDWKKPHWMLSVVKTKKKGKSLVKYNYFGFLWPAWAVMNHKINHFWAKRKKKKNCIMNICTLSIWSCVQKVWIFTLKSFRSIWLLLESLRDEHVQLVILGLATWLALMPYWEQGAFTCLWVLLHVRVLPGGKGFLRVSACHFISCTAEPEQMLLLFGWYVGDQRFMHGTQHSHLQLAPDVSCQAY